MEVGVVEVLMNFFVDQRKFLDSIELLEVVWMNDSHRLAPYTLS